MKKKTQQKTVCIVGAGIGGLTTGALLARDGYTVHLFEREEQLGGRAQSITGGTITYDSYQQLLSRFHMNIPFSEPDLQTIFDHHLLKGYILDLGFHAIGGGVVSHLHQVLSEINQHVEMLESRLAYIRNHGFDYPFLSRADKLKMLPRILRLLIAGESTMNHLDTVSMAEMIKKYGTGKMKLTLEIFPRLITTVNNLNYISAGETFRAQKNLLKGSNPVGYPKNGLGVITHVLAGYITRSGGTIHLGTPVSEICISNAQATGVRADGKEYPCDYVVSNIPVQDLFTVAPQQCFPSSYVKSLTALSGTGSLCAYYSLQQVDTQLLGKSFLFIERDAGVDGNDAVGMIDFIISRPDAGVAPPGSCLVQAYVICTPQEAQSQPILTKLWEIMDTKLEHLIPGYHQQLNWAIYPAVWQLDGVAKTIDNIKTSIQTPIENLYLVGDCVKAPGIGVNCALNSATIVHALLVQSV